MEITDKERFEKGLQYAKATMELEGLKVTEESEQLIKKRLREEITEQEFLDKALEKALANHG